jgi:AmmeMemoRadiSam system protein A
MDQYIKLAKYAIKEYVRTGKIVSVPDNLPPEFYEKKGGVFVSLYKGEELRGCIGTYLPAHKNLAEEITLNAIAACSQDSRFCPVTAEDLPDISVEVSLLSEPEKISDLHELDPKNYGVIVRSPNGQCGLLLPAIEGIDSVEQQLSIACQKGGINPATDKKIKIYKFSVEKYSR